MPCERQYKTTSICSIYEHWWPEKIGKAAGCCPKIFKIPCLQINHSFSRNTWLNSWKSAKYGLILLWQYLDPFRLLSLYITVIVNIYLILQSAWYMRTASLHISVLLRPIISASTLAPSTVRKRRKNVIIFHVYNLNTS
jgi:hypothetical protein